LAFLILVARTAGLPRTSTHLTLGDIAFAIADKSFGAAAVIAARITGGGATALTFARRTANESAVSGADVSRTAQITYGGATPLTLMKDDTRRGTREHM
jgi:hypothetical protein